MAKFGAKSEPEGKHGSCGRESASGCNMECHCVLYRRRVVGNMADMGTARRDG